MKNSLPVKKLMLRAGMMRLMRSVRSRSAVAILRYHSVVRAEDNFYASPSIALDPEVFEKQVAYMSRNYNVVSLDDVHRFLTGAGGISTNPVVFTFDDGYADNLLASRILKKYGVTGTFYISAGCVEGEPLWLFEVIYRLSRTGRSAISIDLDDGEARFRLGSEQEREAAVRALTRLIKSRDLRTRESVRAQLHDQTRDVADTDQMAREVMLTWDQVREMSQIGMTIASHTMTHLNLPNADPADARREIEQSRELLQDRVQQPVDHFSYPNGGDYAYYNQAVKDMVEKAGYHTATTSNNGVARMGDDRLEMNRVRVTANLPEIIYQIEFEPFVGAVLQSRPRQSKR